MVARSRTPSSAPPTPQSQSAHVGGAAVADGRIAMVLSGFPRLSETFVLNDVAALNRRGALAKTVATKPGDGRTLQPAAAQLLDLVQVLPPGSPAEQAAVLADELQGTAVSGVHGYFAHVPAEVAMLTARRLGVPFGFSAHAKDIRTAGRSALTERAQEAACVIACNPDTAGELEALGANVALMPHGVDVERFRTIDRRPGDSDPFRLLAVGRLVAKKGFDVLIDAVAGLDGRLPVDVRIVGDGPERARLLDRISRYRLNESVKLEASLTHRELPAKYAWADAVVVPSVTDRTGDRDGLPNVVLEAMASGRPVLATDAGAISAAVHPHHTGMLVAPGVPDALTDAIRLLAENPRLRYRLGRTGRALVEDRYSLEQCTRRLWQQLEDSYAFSRAG